MKVSKTQLAKIHIAKKDLGLNEENYRDMLSGFSVQSAAALTYDQAEGLIMIFKKLGWKPAARKKDSRFIKVEHINRSPEFATYDQMKMIAALWVEKSREKTKKSLDKFIFNIAHTQQLEWLLASDVQKVKKGIESL